MDQTTTPHPEHTGNEPRAYSGANPFRPVPVEHQGRRVAFNRDTLCEALTHAQALTTTDHGTLVPGSEALAKLQARMK